MTHWGWYWNVKKSYVSRKTLCSNVDSINSFRMFYPLYRAYAQPGNVLYEHYVHKVKLIMGEGCIRAEYWGVPYLIPLSVMPCNYGGDRYFFHCPKCQKRMTILYCIKGVFLCRKCGNLGYYSQRVRPRNRYWHMSGKVKDYIENRAGSIDLRQKPPRMHNDRFQRLLSKRQYYESKADQATNNDLREWYGAKAEPYIDEWFDHVDESKEWRNKRQKKHVNGKTITISSLL